MKLFRNTLAIAVISFSLFACRGGKAEKGAEYSVTFPDAETIEFKAELVNQNGFSLDGEVEVVPYGRLYFLPETPDANFTFGLKMNLSVFLPEGWEGFQETTKLPTGVFFPSWITTPMIDVKVSDNMHAYFGIRGTKYIGLSAHFIGGDIPNVSIGYNFRDEEGNLVVGLLFFAPKLDQAGNVEVPGGLFVGTNLSSFMNQGDGVSQTLSMSMDLLKKYQRGEPAEVNGNSVYTEVEVNGPNARYYNSEKRIKEATARFVRAMK